MWLTVEPVRRVGTLARFRLTGELDVTSSRRLAAYLGKSLARGITTVEIDLSGLRFCDVSGAYALAATDRRLTAMGGGLRLIGGGAGRRVLDLLWPHRFTEQARRPRDRGLRRPARRSGHEAVLLRTELLLTESTRWMAALRRTSLSACEELAEMHDRLAGLHTGLRVAPACGRGSHRQRAAEFRRKSAAFTL